jgi:hypothetical protein
MAATTIAPAEASTQKKKWLCWFNEGYQQNEETASGVKDFK